MLASRKERQYVIMQKNLEDLRQKIGKVQKLKGKSVESELLI